MNPGRLRRDAAAAVVRARAHGFTLAELAIVLVIVALLVGSLLAPLSTQIDSRNLADTRRALAEIRETILGYAVVNGRLPCPALANVASGAAGAGLEGTRAASGCTNIAGVVPWATLGVAETDAWGRRYSYRVTRAFTKAVPPPDIDECPVPPPPTAAATSECCFRALLAGRHECVGHRRGGRSRHRCAGRCCLAR
jgi:prepilin-type N-terminal cleavage/methylation domain-containing protein